MQGPDLQRAPGGQRQHPGPADERDVVEIDDVEVGIEDLSQLPFFQQRAASLLRQQG